MYEPHHSGDFVITETNEGAQVDFSTAVTSALNKNGKHLFPHKQNPLLHLFKSSITTFYTNTHTHTLSLSHTHTHTHIKAIHNPN